MSSRPRRSQKTLSRFSPSLEESSKVASPSTKLASSRQTHASTSSQDKDKDKELAKKLITVKKEELVPTQPLKQHSQKVQESTQQSEGEQTSEKG